MVGLLGWCVACMTGFLWVANLLPGDGVLQRIALVGAAFGGLLFALWSVARLTGSRL